MSRYDKRPNRIGEQTGSEGAPLTISNLDQYFAILQKNIKDRTKEEQKSVEAVEAYRRKVRDDERRNSEDRDRQHILDLARMEEELDAEGLSVSQKLKERYAKTQAAKDKADDKKRLAEYYKQLSSKETQRAKDEEASAERRLQLAKQGAELDSSSTAGEKLGYVGAQLKAGLQDAFSGSGLSNIMQSGLNKLTDALTNGINSAMSKYADYHSIVDTRLQGSYYGVGMYSSSFDTLIDNLGVVSSSGLLSTEELYENLSRLVQDGVVTNLEQRAFLMTMKDTIATTFDANSKALNRIIRIQQDDSTAIRLGMESYLTRFLNEFVESTDYLTSTFDTVAESLLEASSLMSSGESAEFEYVVQKWLGSLQGLGLSDSTASSIATAIGQLASGDVSSLSGSAMQNLIVMAASRAGLSYASMLTNGVTAAEANSLLLGVVEYMQELGSYSSNVVKSELADTFGVTVSDIVAAQNMTESDLETAYASMMSTSDMATELAYQMSQTGSRLGVSKILSNLYDNISYSTGMSIASSPALYALWKMTDLISSATNSQGVAIPSFSVMGNQVDLETTVDALLKGGIAGVGMLSNIGGMISGLTSSLLGSGNVLYAALNASTTFGNAIGKASTGLGYNTGFYSSGGTTVRSSGTSTSSAAYVGNYGSDDYSDSVVNSANDEANQTLDQKKAEEEDAVTGYLKDIEFASKMEQISEDIRAFREDGVKVSNMPNSIESTLTGWSLGIDSLGV